MRRILRYSIVLPVTASYLYVAGSASFLGQWDSYDYLKQIVSHQLSPLGFGRPVFLGYNILLWEAMKHLFHLQALKVEAVVMAGTILLGVAGILIFQRLARQFLSASAARMAVLALAVSPMYAVYSGFIMTEIPMLVALMASALIVWRSSDRHPILSDLAGGILFGLAAGIREQALTMGPAFLWILCCRPRLQVSRIRSILWFGIAAGAAVLSPVFLLYSMNPAGFIERTRIWLHAIPMGRVQFWNNVQASLLYTLAICPAAWMAAAAVAIRVVKRAPGSHERSRFAGAGPALRNPLAGFFCAVVLPIVLLWRDADVQIHPRYAMVALPGALIFCASVYDRWIRSRNGPAIWAIVHVLVFGIALVVISPFRQVQAEKMENANLMRQALPGEALIIAGSYSPILDYYRGIGVRPEWHILWSGWDWDQKSAENLIRKSWAEHVPVYLIEDPLGWRYFESEYLHFYFLLKDCRKEPVIPKLIRVYPR